MGGRVRKCFVVPPDVEVCMETLLRRCGWQLDVMLVAVIMLSDAEGTILGSTRLRS